MTRRELQRDLLLEVWKEVGRHAEIDVSLERLGRDIVREIAFERLLVRRVDAQASRIETLAATGPGTTSESAGGRRELRPDELARVSAWMRAGAVTTWRANAVDDLRRTLEPETSLSATLAGPLVDGQRLLGFLLAQGPREELLASSDFFAALLEPLSVALSNDLRLEELARLREAAEADNRALLSRLQREDISDSVVGERTGLRLVMERVEQVARTDAPVLILGETGSGKEVVARAIHARSKRASGPFLRVNCGAIPPELVDSELFGHEKGSFTGAVNTRRGWFERADGGTLFLDELGELPAAAQVRLLRVLQDGSFERVGGQRSLHVDVRIVAATHRDMRELVEAGKFRSDLWYRVHVFPVQLPPLRERVDDIATLAGHFAARAGKRLFGVELTPTSLDVELLRAYGWPGNVRELASVIERAAILGGGHTLEIAVALGGDPGASPRASAPERADSLDGPSLDGGSLDGSLNRAMARHIADALERTRGRVEGVNGAAALLGVNPHTLRSRMRKLGIDWSRFRAPRV